MGIMVPPEMKEQVWHDNTFKLVFKPTKVSYIFLLFQVVPLMEEDENNVYD